MALFGNGHKACVEEFAALRSELAELRKRVALAESTVEETAASALRHMKKAEQAARRALEAAEPNQGPGGQGVAAATPALPLSGARARIMARRLAAAQAEVAAMQPLPAEAAMERRTERANGVHP